MDGCGLTIGQIDKVSVDETVESPRSFVSGLAGVVKVMERGSGRLIFRSMVFAKKIIVQVPSQREACAARKGSGRLDYLTPASLCFFIAAAGIDFLAPDGCSF